MLTRSMTEEEERISFERSGDQMLNNMTPNERRRRGLPPYHLTEDEKRRISGKLTKKEQDNLDRVKKEAAESNAKIAEEVMQRTYKSNYHNWTEFDRRTFREEWKHKVNMSRQQMYELVRSNSGDPWAHILNCLADAPPDPSNKQLNQSYVDRYYDILLPDCAVAWEWYNTPGVDLGDPLDRLRLEAKFAYSPKAHGEIAAEKLIDGAGKVLPKLEVPFYFSGVVIAMLAVAVIAVKAM